MSGTPAKESGANGRVYWIPACAGMTLGAELASGLDPRHLVSMRFTPSHASTSQPPESRLSQRST